MNFHTTQWGLLNTHTRIWVDKFMIKFQQEHCIWGRLIYSAMSCYDMLCIYLSATATCEYNSHVSCYYRAAGLLGK